MPILLLAPAEVGVSTEYLWLLLLTVALAIITPWLLRRTRQASRANPSASTTRDPRLVLQETVDKAMVDLLETGREISARIDTKIRILNKLVKDADRQARRLEALAGKDAPTSPPTSSAPEEASATAEPPSTADEPARRPSGRFRTDIHDRIDSLRREGREAGEIARLTRLSRTEVNLVLSLLEREATESG